MVRRLIIMRHAKAERMSASGGDFDRGLTDQGRADARLVSLALAKSGLEPDLILLSPAARTRQTWEAAAPSFGAARVVENADLYNAEERQIRRAVADEDDLCDTLLLIGHNPGVHALAARMLSESGASGRVMDQVSSGFPTASAIAFQFEEDGRAHYDGLYLARDLGGAGD